MKFTEGAYVIVVDRDLCTRFSFKIHVIISGCSITLKHKNSRVESSENICKDHVNHVSVTQLFIINIVYNLRIGNPKSSTNLQSKLLPIHFHNKL